MHHRLNQILAYMKANQFYSLQTSSSVTNDLQFAIATNPGNPPHYLNLIHSKKLSEDLNIPHETVLFYLTILLNSELIYAPAHSSGNDPEVVTRINKKGIHFLQEGGYTNEALTDAPEMPATKV